MASNAIVGERPACDFCHSRKIKCDRQSPCDNCVDSRVDCRRDRPRKSRRAKASRVSLPGQLVAPESTPIIFQGPEVSASSNEDRTHHAAATGLAENRRVVNNSGHASYARHQNRGRAQRANAKSGWAQQTSEGTRFLQQELESNPSLGATRSRVLREAIDLVGHLSDTPNLSFAPDSFDVSGTGGGHESQGFPPELLYMMTINTEPSIMKQSFWPDHVSFPTLEGMCLSLMEGKEDQHTLRCYRVCVYMKAATFICRLPRKDQSAPLRKHLEESKKQYEHETQKALSELDFLAPPSLILLQAFLSGALFMQNQGDMSRSWTLTAFASRTLVSLNYHTIDTYLPYDATKQDVYGALYSCYYLDKILSGLLFRPPSLPKLKVKPANLVRLDPRLPLSASIKIMVELAQIQEGVLDILLNPRDEAGQLAVIDKLVRDMHDIRTLIDKHQHQLPFRGTTYEWVAIEFGYYTLLTSILHLNHRLVRSPPSQEECLRASRQSLVRLRKMQDKIATDANFLDEYPYFLTWTLLFYPLTPFFVLFCNVVCSVNFDDYALMAAVTKGISRFVEKQSSIAALYKLFSTFLRLVDPLIHNHPNPPLSRPDLDPGVALSDRSMVDTPTTAVRDPRVVNGNSIIGSNPVPSGRNNLQEQTPPSPGNSADLDNDLMWTLLDSQPWVGWITSNALTDPPTSTPLF